MQVSRMHRARREVQEDRLMNSRVKDEDSQVLLTPLPFFLLLLPPSCRAFSQSLTPLLKARKFRQSSSSLLFWQVPGVDPPDHWFYSGPATARRVAAPPPLCFSPLSSSFLLSLPFSPLLPLAFLLLLAPLLEFASFSFLQPLI